MSSVDDVDGDEGDGDDFVWMVLLEVSVDAYLRELVMIFSFGISYWVVRVDYLFLT